MNAGRDVERLIAAWLAEEAPVSSPDGILHAAARVIDRTKQRRAWRVPWRLPSMNCPALAAAIVVAAVVAVAAFVFLREPASVASPPSPAPSAAAVAASSAPSVEPTPPDATASATTSDAPTASAFAADIDGSPFAIPFRMTWDTPVTIHMKSQEADFISNAAGMNLFNVTRVAKDPCHSNNLTASPLTSPQQFMDWLSTIPKTTSGPVSHGTVDGVPALERIVTVGTLDGCIDTGDLHSGIDTQDNGTGWFMAAGDVEHWVVLEHNGKLLAIVLWPNGDESLNGSAVRALASIKFLN